ncbi:MAG: hypothetical protein ISS93_03550 [Candidatus Aenigmarchaeota archaeon]|nr:hypothetical protein [Candidatus Aenigmarchaeota archaeon]
MKTTLSVVNFNVCEYPVGANTGGVVGLGKERDLSPLTYKGEVATEITDKGKQYKDLHNDSITAQGLEALWNFYLLADLGNEPTEEEARILSYLFDTFGQGNVCNNGVDYNDHGDLSEKEGYSRAAIVTHPKKFTKNKETGLWKIGSEGSEVVHDYVPGTGFPLLTNDGTYNPITFVPFSTVTDRETAEASYINKGFSPEFARKVVSRFWSAKEGEGAKSVVRYCYVGWGNGRFSLGAGYGPGDRDDDIGRLFASRPASGASPADEIQIEPVSPAEYKRVVGELSSTRRRAADAEKAHQTLKDQLKELVGE